MLKACSRCGKIHPQGYRCKVGIKRTYERGEPSKLRNSKAWRDKSIEVREKAQGLCEVCKDMGIYNYRGIEVHHIDPLSNEPSKLLDNANLIALCTYHHKQAEKGELDKDYLHELANKREKI